MVHFIGKLYTAAHFHCCEAHQQLQLQGLSQAYRQLQTTSVVFNADTGACTIQMPSAENAQQSTSQERLTLQTNDCVLSSGDEKKNFQSIHLNPASVPLSTWFRSPLSNILVLWQNCPFMIVARLEQNTEERRNSQFITLTLEVLLNTLMLK